ncbi:MAG TPA: hypothetical protein VGB84_00235 [Arachidicoccus sp.]
MAIEEFYNQELNEWQKSIYFYLEDINMMEERLRYVTEKNTKTEVLQGVEHFQNQFIAQRAALQLLKHEVHRQKETFETEIENSFQLTNLSVVDTQFLLREKVHTAEKIFIETKHSFYRFLANVY